MPLPLIIGGIAALAGVVGVGSGIDGGVKMKKANDTNESAKRIQERAIALFEKKNAETTELMDSIGKQELEILSSFKIFSDIYEKIQGRPEFKSYKKEGVTLQDYEAEELQKVSAGASIVLGSLGGAAVGTAGGVAAAGITTSAVMALGTASTGTAISSLSGAAATNATLAALGGGSIATGGGGMALGAAVLSGATLGVGLLFGGILFNAVGSNFSNKADETFRQAKKIEKEVSKIVGYFDELVSVANPFKSTLTEIEKQYRRRLVALDHIVNFSEKLHWSEFTDQEKKLTENTVLLVGLLFKMCKISLVLKNQDGDCLNEVNKNEVNTMIDDANKMLNNVKDVA